MGGNLFHCSKDWLYARDSACLGRQHERDTGGGDGGLTTAERQRLKELIMLPSETMIWQPEFTDKTLSRKPGAVHSEHITHCTC